MKTPLQRTAILIAVLVGAAVMAVGMLPDLLIEDELELWLMHALLAGASILFAYYLIHRMLVARLRAERSARALLTDLDTLEMLIDNIHFCVAYLDPDFNFVRVNGAFAEEVGYPRSELAGRNYFQLLPNAEVEALLRRARETGEPIALNAHRFITAGRPDADARYWDWSLAPVSAGNGRLEGWVLSTIEVTEAVEAGKRRERLLAENLQQRQLLEAIFAADPDGLAVLAGPDFSFRRANPAYRALTLDPEVELIGRAYAEVWQDPGCEARLAAMRQVADTGAPAEAHLEERVYPDGRRRYLSFFVRRLPADAEHGVLVVLQDNTAAEEQRRRADAASSEAQRRANELDVIFSAMAEGVLVYDASGTLIRLNPAAAAVFAPGPVEPDRGRLVQKLGMRRRYSGPVAVADLPSSRALAGETVLGDHLILDRPNCEPMAILSSSSPLITDGVITGAVTVWHDVTGIERVEEDLRRTLAESEQRQAEIEALLTASRAVAEHREFERASAAILDACQNLLGASAACLAIQVEGEGPAPAFRWAPRAHCPAGGPARVTLCEKHLQAYQSGELVVENDIPAGECARALVAGDLSPRNLLFAPLVVRGSPVGLLTVSNKPEGFDERDVRLGRAFAELAAIALANYQTLQLLETSEERFRSVVENANDAMITLDKDGHIVFWNRAAELMFGCPGETIAGLPFTALLDSQAAGESASETWQERLEKASAVEGKSREAVGLRRDGSRFPLEYSFAPWNSREGLFVTASVRDLTARQQAHSRAQQLAALEERQRLARELHDSVSQALYGIALGANTALTQLDTSRARTVEALDYVISLADLALTEMRALIFDLRPESLEREGLAAGLTKHISALRVRYGIEITCDIPEEPAVPLSVKETVYGIVREALQNAVKHSQSTHINVRLARGPHALDVEVSDDGAGFDPEQPYPGHLGLASMRERAALAHGILEVASGHGQGTCVTARIPLAVSSIQLG